MAKAKTAYVCTECGASALQVVRQCPSCGAAGTLSETVVEKAAAHRYAGAAAASVALARHPRAGARAHPDGVSELDRVLGGGLVAGQVILLGGDPGIGKSTLLLQTLASLTFGKRHVGAVRERRGVGASRWRCARGALRSMRAACGSSPRRSSSGCSRRSRPRSPRVAVIDSIQTIWSETLQSAPGSVAQVRECAAQLTRHRQARRDSRSS